MSIDDGHIPVLTKPLLEVLKPSNNEVVVDCTLGAGGHARSILAMDPGIRLIGFDVDSTALEKARENLADYAGRVTFVQANFGDLARILSEQGLSEVDAIYADIGVSSMQIDQPERGFSFLQDGPLDMRMDRNEPKRAADIVNSYKETELADLIFKYGEEGKSRKIAHLIIQARRSHRIDSTAELASIVCQALGFDPQSISKQRIHPATKTFQALRIAVNHELENLEALLETAPTKLKHGGRFAVICFHSLEDRLVKERFRKLSSEGGYQLLTAKPIEAESVEILRNPRSRSAKLRALQKLS